MLKQACPVDSCTASLPEGGMLTHGLQQFTYHYPFKASSLPRCEVHVRYWILHWIWDFRTPHTPSTKLWRSRLVCSVFKSKHIHAKESSMSSLSFDFHLTLQVLCLWPRMTNIFQWVLFRISAFLFNPFHLFRWWPGPETEAKLSMAPGDVYLSSPAFFAHEVRKQELWSIRNIDECGTHIIDEYWWILYICHDM